MYNIPQQKPIDQLWKKMLKSSKYSNCHRFEIIPKMHETWKSMKNEEYKGLTSLRGQKPCKRFGGKRQKFALTLRPIKERENSVWKDLKKWWTHETQSF